MHCNTYSCKTDKVVQGCSIIRHSNDFFLLFTQVQNLNGDATTLKEKHPLFEEPVDAKVAELNENWEQLTLGVSQFTFCVLLYTPS